mgnify:FL=1
MQAAKIRAYAEVYDLDVVALVEEPATTAKRVRTKTRKGRRAQGVALHDSGQRIDFMAALRLQRPRLIEAFDLMVREKCTALVIAKLDRLTRSVIDLGALIEEFFHPESGTGFSLMSVGDQIDTSSASGRMLVNILATIAQWERETISERTKAAMHHKYLLMEYTGGNAPYGWRVNEDGKHLVADPLEQGMIMQAREYRASGLSLRAVGAMLELRGVHPREGDGWKAQTVKDLLTSPTIEEADALSV